MASHQQLFRRAGTVQLSTFTPGTTEIVADTTTISLRIGDSSQAGGYPIHKFVAAKTTVDANGIVYAASTTTLTTSTSLVWDTSTLTVKSTSDQLSLQYTGGSSTTLGTQSGGDFAILSSSNIYFRVFSGTNSTIIGTAGQLIVNSTANSVFSGSGNLGIGITSPTNILSLSGQAARIFWMERHTTSNTAGNTLTVQAGGATSAATDKNGGALILSPGVSTGTGRSNVQIKGYTTATATGTSDNTAIDVAIFNGFKTLTNNSATALISCTVANGSSIAGILKYAVEVLDGTDHQIEEGCISFHVTNKAGSLANNTTVKFGNQQAMTAGTLTCTWTITAANPAVVTLNANSSLTPSTGYPRVRYNVENLTNQAISIQ